MSVSERAAVRRLVSDLRADFRINEFADQRLTLVIWRIGQMGHGRAGAAAFVARRLHGLFDLVWTRLVIGAELPRSVQAGGGIRLPHAGRGVIIFPSARIGSGVTLYHQVTIGVRGPGLAPVLGDGVYVGAGAKILGAIVIGDRSRIGANAVVLHDVPNGRTAVGVPARILAERPDSGSGKGTAET